MRKGYSNNELRALSQNARPEQGEICSRCREVIPEFADLDEQITRELTDLAEESRTAAIQRLRSLTGCPLSWAKLWVLHKAHSPGPSCPYCGAELFNERTRQCLQCGMDWHDAENPVRHRSKVKRSSDLMT